MPFGGSPSTDDSDAVRVLVGDLSTSTGNELLSDNTYDYLIGRTDTLDEAAAEAARTLAGKFAQEADLRVGRLSKQFSQRSQAYLRLAERFDSAVAEASLTGVSPFLGGRSKADKRAAEDDDDRVDTFAARGMLDFPGSPGLDEPSTST